MYIRNRNKTTKIVILGTDTDPKEDLSADDVDRLDRNRGMVMIGCHYLIRLDGMVETGRPLEKRGNRRRTLNPVSVFIDLVGKADHFTTEQLDSLQEIEAELRELYPNAEAFDYT